MGKRSKLLSLTAALALSGAANAQTPDANAKPTIVLVHGAFAESSSWNGVIARLEKHGYPTIAAANPLRSVKTDSASVAAVVRAVPGPVILVGHSYGGLVITNAANSAPNVKALVYVAGFIPDAGESSLTLAAKFPGSTLGEALKAVDLPDGAQDLYIRPEMFHEQFAADASGTQAALMSATQRPVAQAALAEESGAASWKKLPSYVIYGSADRNIPAAVETFMAERARARKTVGVDGASHAIMISHPDKVAALIEDAASAP